MRNLWRNAGAYIALLIVTLIFAIKQPGVFWMQGNQD
jgi:hypothetical protein